MILATTTKQPCREEQVFEALMGVSMSGEKLASLVFFKGVPGARIQRDLTINNLQMVYYCQTKSWVAWVDKSVFSV
jgi:hypothetical protein